MICMLNCTTQLILQNSGNRNSGNVNSGNVNSENRNSGELNFAAMNAHANYLANNLANNLVVMSGHDYFPIAAMPEPSEGMVLLCGLLIAGFIARRRLDANWPSS